MRSSYTYEPNSAILIFITLIRNDNKYRLLKLLTMHFSPPPHHTIRPMQCIRPWVSLASHTAGPRSIPGWGLAMEETSRQFTLRCSPPTLYQSYLIRMDNGPNRRGSLRYSSVQWTLLRWYSVQWTALRYSTHYVKLFPCSIGYVKVFLCQWTALTYSSAQWTAFRYSSVLWTELRWNSPQWTTLRYSCVQWTTLRHCSVQRAALR